MPIQVYICIHSGQLALQTLTSLSASLPCLLDGDGAGSPGNPAAEGGVRSHHAAPAANQDAVLHHHRPAPEEPRHAANTGTHILEEQADYSAKLLR